MQLALWQSSLQCVQCYTFHTQQPRQPLQPASLTGTFYSSWCVMAKVH